MIRYLVRAQFFMLISVVLWFVGCTNKATRILYLAEQKEVLRNDAKVNVVSKFPIIVSSKPDSKIDSLNGLLKHINHLEQLVKKDFDAKDEKVNVIGNYSILSNTENIACLEFLVSIPAKNKNVYRPVFIDLNKKKRIDPNDVFEISDSRELLPYIKQFCDSIHTEINVSVYERNDGTALVYGVTDENIILYLGGEGEDYGNYRISIPIINLRHH